MNLKKSFILGFFAALLSASSAFAVYNYQSGDWLLGFYSPSAGKSFVLNLGSRSTGTSFSLSNPSYVPNVPSATSTTMVASLVTAFGTNWYTRSDLYYGLVSEQSPSNDLTFSLPGNPGAGNYYNTGNTTADATYIDGIGTGNGNQTIANSQTSSWSTIAGPGGPLGGDFNNGGSGGAFGDGFMSQLMGYSVEIDKMPGDGSNSFAVGLLNIDSSGKVTYTSFAAPVPEPSTFAALASGAGLLALVRRRRV